MKPGFIETILKGFVIGSTMLVPGVSGGSMAMILGIYHNLISAVSSFSKNVKNNFLFLFLFVAAAVGGMILLAKPLLALIGNYPHPTLYFFIGAVLGGIPLIFKEARMKHFSVAAFTYVVVGVILVIGISFLPQGMFAQAGGAEGYLVLVAAGIVAAVALILPGISVSYMLLVIGLYESTMGAISALDFRTLGPMAIGVFLGIVLTTKILEKAMNSFPQPTYLIILGFILGSVAKIFPGLPTGTEWIICPITLVAGFAAIKLISKT